MLFLFSITWGAVSGWSSVICVLLGFLYAWAMYRQPVNLNQNFRYFLSALRALAIFFIAMLLLFPLIKTVSYKPEKPLILILQDNSESVKLFNPNSYNISSLTADLEKVRSALGDNYEVHEFNFDHSLNNGLSNKFNGKQTDISAALKQLNERYVNQNIGAIILATDGLYNQGSDPQYEARNFKTTFYTIALGDTAPKRDLLIANVNYNRTAYLGNDFEIEILTKAYQSKGENMHLNVTEDGRQVAIQNVQVPSNDFQKLFPLKLNADKKGLCKFTISIAPIKNELSTQNNTEVIYVDVLDAKQKILLVYNGPHPDISVIKGGIESNRNYEVKTTLLADLAKIKTADYSLVIFYQLSANSSPLLQQVEKTKTPAWYILGGQTNLQDFNIEQRVLKILSGKAEMQEVFAQPVPEFTAFTLSDSTRQKIAFFPPLMAPFGTYTSTNANQILLKQKIGSVLTAYPLLSFSDDNGQRIGILTGEGLWRWQLADYKANGNHHAIEELLSQSVQYLTASANRQQFRVYEAKNVFDEGENVIINAELYNDALELINTPDVKIDLKNSVNKNYSFLFSRNEKSYQLDAGTLPVGEYTYVASTKLNNKQFTTNGQFTIAALNLENRQSAANHQLLDNIARQSGGKMLMPDQISELTALIHKNENIKTIVYEDKHYSDLIDIKWVFVIIIALLSIEWFLRKREGEV